MKKIFFEKTRIFSALDERDCQAASLFAHWGQFGRERRAWPNGADPPIFHMHRGEISHFFKIRGFPATQVGLCVDGPCKTAGHLQNTPGTPAMDFPLGASGSQSALYVAGHNDDYDPQQYCGGHLHLIQLGFYGKPQLRKMVHFPSMHVEMG